MEKITYGATRYMDWVAQIKAGAATLRVHFTGGALTAYGVTPAEYTTSDPFVQRVIEQSQYFKEGRIVKLRSTPLADVKRAVTPEKATAEGMTEVEVSCLQDAQDYLQQHFGISSYKVRSKVSAQKVASEHGVVFVYAAEAEE